MKKIDTVDLTGFLLNFDRLLLSILYSFKWQNELANFDMNDAFFPLVWLLWLTSKKFSQILPTLMIRNMPTLCSQLICHCDSYYKLRILCAFCHICQIIPNCRKPSYFNFFSAMHLSCVKAVTVSTCRWHLGIWCKYPRNKHPALLKLMEQVSHLRMTYSLFTISTYFVKNKG